MVRPETRPITPPGLLGGNSAARVIPPFPVYLFDVDGTLMDSAADICGAVQSVLAGTTRPDVPFEFLRGYIGRHLNDLFSVLFPDAPPEYSRNCFSSTNTRIRCATTCTKAFPACARRFERAAGP